MTIIHASLRGDRHVKPALVDFRPLTVAEVRAAGRAWIIDRQGHAAEVEITSVKTWKRRPCETEVHCKYGLREFFVISCPGGAEAETEFLARVYKTEQAPAEA